MSWQKTTEVNYSNTIVIVIVNGSITIVLL